MKAIDLLTSICQALYQEAEQNHIHCAQAIENKNYMLAADYQIASRTFIRAKNIAERTYTKLLDRELNG